MPTVRPRHTLTETPSIARALDDAAELWPDLDRSQLLRRLVEAGHEAVVQGGEQRAASRLRALREAAGAATGAYPAHAAAELKAEWRE